MGMKSNSELGCGLFSSDNLTDNLFLLGTEIALVANHYFRLCFDKMLRRKNSFLMPDHKGKKSCLEN